MYAAGREGDQECREQDLGHSNVLSGGTAADKALEVLFDFCACVYYFFVFLM